MNSDDGEWDTARGGNHQAMEANQRCTCMCGGMARSTPGVGTLATDLRTRADAKSKILVYAWRYDHVDNGSGHVGNGPKYANKRKVPNPDD